MIQNTLYILVVCFASWAKVISQNSIDFSKPVPISTSTSLSEKWFFLKEALGDKQIVCLGESLHGVSEYNEAKFEIIQYLHEEMGFNLIAFETDLALSHFGSVYRMDIPDRLLLREVFSPVWHTESYLKLVAYLKRNPSLKLIGFDYWGMNNLDSIVYKLAVNIDTSIAINAKLIKHYDGLKIKYDKSQFVDNRDSVMANNIKWLVEELYPNEKMIISAANDHVSRVKSSKYGFMGEILSRELKEEPYIIALFHSLGNPIHLYRDFFYENDSQQLDNNSLQARLLNEKSDNLFIEVSKTKRLKKYQWLGQPVKHVLKTKKYEYTVNIAQSFDAIIWYRKVTYPNFVIDSKYHWLRKK